MTNDSDKPNPQPLSSEQEEVGQQQVNRDATKKVIPERTRSGDVVHRIADREEAIEDNGREDTPGPQDVVRPRVPKAGDPTWPFVTPHTNKDGDEVI